VIDNDLQCYNFATPISYFISSPALAVRLRRNALKRGAQSSHRNRKPTVAIVHPARRRHPISAIKVVARAEAVELSLSISLDVAA